MRILQLIDSLSVGGAEKMAVNYANALSAKIEVSALVATRAEGSLKNFLHEDVKYQFLQRRGKIGFRALFRLRNFCRENKILVVHAHASSFFLAAMLRLVMPKIKVVWHDHNGARNSASAVNTILKLSAKLFGGVIVVNQQLLEWASRNLRVQNTIYLPNFTPQSEVSTRSRILNGTPGHQILMLANLRHPKNHHLVAEVAKRIRIDFPDWTFHFVGDEKGDAYSQQLHDFIAENKLEETVYLYGLRSEAAQVVNEAEICVIASDYEGLPVALLEFGLAAKAVLSTAVGEIPLIVKNGENGLLTPPGDADAFYQKLKHLIENRSLRKDLGEKLAATIARDFSEPAVISRYLKFMESIAPNG